jgi:hypothetical protein
MVVVLSETPKREKQQPGSGGYSGYGSIVEIVDARIAAFKTWLLGEQRRFHVSVGDRIDVIADVMGSGTCGEVSEVTEMPEELESVSMPMHHYQAILRLYKKDIAMYRALLDQSKEYIDHLANKKMDSLADSVAGTRNVLARIIHQTPSRMEQLTSTNDLVTQS